ncbi:MAG: immunity protein Imm33 domain-containing protein [Hyphomonas sp.]
MTDDSDSAAAASYSIDDPRPIAAEAPYTFARPADDRLDLLQAGDIVKLIFRAIPADRKYPAERMWVEITTINGEKFEGTLVNHPDDMPMLNYRDVVTFNRWHIIDYRFEGEGRDAHLPPIPPKQYWERCLVDQEILDGTARVGYLYREEADMTREGDQYPDSGWRIRADVYQLTDEQYENPNPQYVALGAVLNRDDTWLHLIDAPIGSRYMLNQDTEIFEPSKDDD